jgi:hypothetical protein
MIFLEKFNEKNTKRIIAKEKAEAEAKKAKDAQANSATSPQQAQPAVDGTSKSANVGETNLLKLAQQNKQK